MFPFLSIFFLLFEYFLCVSLYHSQSSDHSTDGAYALSRIDGKLGYPPEDELAAEIREIGQFSGTLHGLGVHVELHLSPGHAMIPGNVAADAMAKKTQRKLFLQATKSGPTMGSADRLVGFGWPNMI